MPLLLLIRHGENDYVKTGKMAGRLPGVHLNERGQKQAQALGEALKDVPIKAVYSSPLERAMETATPIANGTQIADHSGTWHYGCGYWQVAGKIMEGFAFNKGMEDRATFPLPFSLS